MTLNDYKIYIHRERGHTFIPYFSGKSFVDVLNLEIEGFRFVPSKQKEMGRFGCKVTVCTPDGIRIAGINLHNGKVFFDTKLGLQKTLDNFIKSLQSAEIEITNSAIKYGYVEVCARLPWEMVSKSHELLSNIQTAFRTKKTNSSRRLHDSVKSDWLFLVKNVLFSKYLVNIKVYLAVKYRHNKYNNDLIIGVDDERLPKVEVQISHADNLEIAKSECIPIIVAFLQTLRCTGEEMIEGDYELVGFVEKYAKGYQDILQNMSPVSAIPKVRFFDSTNLSNRAKKIIEILYEKPRSVTEIQQELQVSENTVRDELERLKKANMVCSRGRSGIQAMHAIKL